jgi:hypothetical protein
LKKRKEKRIEAVNRKKEREETLRNRTEICRQYNLRKKKETDEKNRRNETALANLIDKRKRTKLLPNPRREAIAT